MDNTKVVYDISDNSVIELPLTEEELAQKEIDRKKLEQQEKELKARENARQTILDRLGLTEEEARLLLG